MGRAQIRDTEEYIRTYGNGRNMTENTALRGTSKFVPFSKYYQR
jgi:hypothetical protein